MYENEQKKLLEQNWKSLEAFSDIIYNTINNSIFYKVGSYCGKMGCKLISNNQYIQKSDIKGIYVVFLKYKDYYIILYVGESEKSLGTRIGRFIKQAAGENGDDEFHSGGQLIYDKFTLYKREDVWRNNLYVKFITLNEIKNILGYTAYPSFNLIEGEKYEIISKLDSKVLLKYFESRMIDRFCPISNKISQSFHNTDLFSENIRQFNMLCNTINKKTNSDIKSRPLIQTSIDNLAIVWYIK